MITRPYLLLLLAEHSGHGYDLVERLSEFGIDTGTPASVYRQLREMERGGLVRSVWELSQSRGPARRVYSLTPVGRRALDTDLVALEALERSLDQLRARHAALQGRLPARKGPSARNASRPPRPAARG